MANEKKNSTKRHFDKRFFVFLFLAIIYLCGAVGPVFESAGDRSRRLKTVPG